jgi:CDP-diacylglycerol--glycerol-3-phosphate 3-phosphatidyltransferase
VFIASLYVGKEETELVRFPSLPSPSRNSLTSPPSLVQVSTLHSAFLQNPSLHVTLLVDYLRSTRETPHPSSASLLATLAASFPEQVDLRLYHTPELNGWARKLVPKRFNEGWGLQHMKIYGVDDDVIISGCVFSVFFLPCRLSRFSSTTS